MEGPVRGPQKIREPAGSNCLSHSSPFSGDCLSSRGANRLPPAPFSSYLLSAFCWRWTLKSLLAVLL